MTEQVRQVPATPRGYRSVLANREFLGLLISRVVSLVGDQLARVALTVLVFSRTGSPLLSAATYAATFLPAVVGGPLLGGLADRLPRRRLLVFTDLLRGGLFALMAVPGLPLTVLLALVLVATTVEAPWAAARAPLMRDILIDDDGYQLGTGLDEALNDSGQVVGFAAAGALLAVFSTSAALLLDAVSFGVSAVAVRLLVQQRAAADPGRPAGAPGPMRRRWTSRVAMALSDARLGLRAATAPSCRRPLLLTWAGISDEPRVRGRPDRRTGPGAGGGRAARLAPHRCGRTAIYGRCRSIPRLRQAFLGGWCLLPRGGPPISMIVLGEWP